MTKEELKAKREALGLEILKRMDEITKLIDDHAKSIGEERPLAIVISSRTQDPYLDVTSYIDLTYCDEVMHLTRDEAHRLPKLLEFCRSSSGNIRHQLICEKFLGEED